MTGNNLILIIALTEQGSTRKMYQLCNIHMIVVTSVLVMTSGDKQVVARLGEMSSEDSGRSEHASE